MNEAPTSAVNEEDLKQRVEGFIAAYEEATKKFEVTFAITPAFTKDGRVGCRVQPVSTRQSEENKPEEELKSPDA